MDNIDRFRYRGQYSYRYRHGYIDILLLILHTKKLLDFSE